MKSRDLIFVLILLTIVGGLYYLSTKNKAKPMPVTVPAHSVVTARTDCFGCHKPEKFAELEAQHKHPGKWRDERVSCLLCHTKPDGSKAEQRFLREREQFAQLLRQ